MKPDTMPARRIYIAARFSRRHECHALAKRLISLGHTITARWVHPDSDHVVPVGMSPQAADAERARFALEDVEDVYSCNLFVALMEADARNNSRGGRHVEFGIAIALDIPLVVIGNRETVFHHLPQVEHYDSVDKWLGESARGFRRGEFVLADGKPAVVVFANGHGEVKVRRFRADRERMGPPVTARELAPLLASDPRHPLYTAPDEISIDELAGRSALRKG